MASYAPMSRGKRSELALASVAAAALLLFLFLGERVAAAPMPGACSGVLTTSGDRFAIVEEPEHICVFSAEDKNKIFAICAEGHYCEVEGLLHDCKDAGECSEITNVVSVRDTTLARQQEQPPLPDAPPSSQPFDLASLPAEIRLEIEPVVRTCRSPVTVVGEFSSYLVDHSDRFLTFHFENVRCADLTAICKTDGCLHQIYLSEGNEPYQLITSVYVFEVQLGHFDGVVGAKITSKEGTRVVRLPQ